MFLIGNRKSVIRCQRTLQTEDNSLYKRCNLLFYRQLLLNISGFWISIIRINFWIKYSHILLHSHIIPQGVHSNCVFILIEFFRKILDYKPEYWGLLILFCHKYLVTLGKSQPPYFSISSPAKKEKQKTDVCYHCKKDFFKRGSIISSVMESRVHVLLLILIFSGPSKVTGPE